MEKTIERPRATSKLQSDKRVFLNGQSKANSEVFSRSQILPLSFSAHKMKCDSMTVNSKHRLDSSISAFDHKRSASSPVFPFPDSHVQLLASSPQFSPDPALSPECDGDESVAMSSSEIVEDQSSQWEHRSSSSRSISLHELLEAEARDGDESSSEQGDHFFSRDLTGFSNSACHSGSTASMHQATFIELLISDAKDHSGFQSCHKRISFSSWKARLKVLQSKWKRIVSTVFQKHSTPGPRMTQLRLPSPEATILGSDSQRVIANRWFMKPPRSKPPSQTSANWLSRPRSSSSPSRISRQLSIASCSTHELYYLSRRNQSDRLRKRTYLPYREQLISYFSCMRS